MLRRFRIKLMRLAFHLSDLFEQLGERIEDELCRDCDCGVGFENDQPERSLRSV